MTPPAGAVDELIVRWNAEADRHRDNAARCRECGDHVRAEVADAMCRLCAVHAAMLATMTEPDRALTAGQVAARLGESVETVRRWMRTEQCPTVRVGRATRVPESWVDAQLKGKG